MEIIENSDKVGKKAIATVGRFQIPVVIKSEIFSHHRTKFLCVSDVDGVKGSDYLEPKDLFFL